MGSSTPLFTGIITDSFGSTTTITLSDDGTLSVLIPTLLLILIAISLLDFIRRFFAPKRP